MNWADILMAVYLAGVVVALFCAGFWWKRLSKFNQVWIAPISAAWPFVLAVGVVMAIGFIPFWLGRKSREWAR